MSGKSELSYGEVMRIIEELRDDEMIRPVKGKIEYDSSIKEEWPDFPLDEFMEILADDLFDWHGATDEFMTAYDFPKSEKDIATEERKNALAAGQVDMFKGQRL